MNVEKAFYWYKKVTENINNHSIDKFCEECKQPFIDYYWCQQCNTKKFQQDLSKWTSKNEFVDKFIREAQLNAKNSYDVLEWIPYNRLRDINYISKGGFGIIYEAIWLDGPINSWNFDKQQWSRQSNHEVILRSLNDSSKFDEFINEWKYHYNLMSYAKKGNLRKCLSDIVKLEWQYKLQLLKNIILGLKTMHVSNLVHCDLHDGNILMSDNYEAYIIDLGLCKPINDSLQAENETNYGVLPYMAPEILRNDPYTSARDIYSFSMIMWEFTSGVPPFSNKVYDNCQLILDICNGERPEIIKGTPKCYIDLMKKCWDGKPENRPTIVSLEHIITQWFRSVSKYYELNEENDEHFAYMDDDILQFRSDIEEFVEANKSLLSQEQTNTYIEQSRPQLSNTSRSFEIIYQTSLSKEESEKYDNLMI
ncbi:unnamed protein product [Rhizophagus irregularis]|nr:unnamed protein product [Rhizophagus irregularis]